ncbi:MAG: hypothetical protein JW727_04245 [Candidatus Aenigmarchaeota archaeon]|nr:hypothetical protein [Candidatus Aenigmarchaeota archaeon]
MSGWGLAPEDLRGQAVSYGELVRLYPENEPFSGLQTLEDEKDYRYYGITEKRGKRTIRHPLAYECKKCDEIRWGPPYVKDFNNMRALSGGRGYVIYCREELPRIGRLELPGRHLLQEIVIERS